MNCSFVGFSLPDIPMCHCKGGSGEDEGWRPLQSTVKKAETAAESEMTIMVIALASWKVGHVTL